MIFGFQDGSSENQFEGKLGSPTKETIDRDSEVKTLVYTPLNLQFSLLKKKKNVCYVFPESFAYARKQQKFWFCMLAVCSRLAPTAGFATRTKGTFLAS